jgi:FtsZ-binding cell division protein ZapB
MSIGPSSTGLSVPEGFSPKSFWKRPEGKPGMLLLAAVIGVGGFYTWGKVVPFVLTTLQSTFWSTIYLVALLAIFDVAFGITGVGKQIRTVGINVFQSLARAIAWTYTTIDPIGILRNNLDEMKNEKNSLDQTVQRFAGSEERLKRRIEEKKSELTVFGRKAEKAQQLMAVTRDNLEKERLSLERETNLGKAGLLMQGVKQLEALHVETSKMLVTFRQWSQVADAKIQRTEYKVDFLADQRKMILDAKATLGAGQRLLRGNPEQLKMVDMALEYLEEDTARTLGEIREFSRYTDKLLTDDQIENSVAADEAAAKFAEFSKKLTLSGDQQSISDLLQIPTNRTGSMGPIPVERTTKSSDIGNLFE